MAAGMEIIILTRKAGHPAQIVTEHLRRKGTGIRISGTQIHGVGSVGNQFAKVQFFQSRHGNSAVRRIFLFRLGAPGIPGKEGKRIGINGLSGANHGQIAVCS